MYSLIIKIIIFLGFSPYSYYAKPITEMIKVPIVQLQRGDGFIHPHKEAIIKSRLDILLDLYKMNHSSQLNV